MKNKYLYFLFPYILYRLFCLEVYAQTYSQYKYGSPNHDERTQKGVLHNGSLYLFTDSQIRTPLSFNSTLRLVKFDSLMNVNFEKDFQYQGGMKVRNLVSITDSSLLGVGTTYDTINYLTSTILLYCKENGDTLWTTTLYKAAENVILDYVTTLQDTLVLFGTCGSFAGGNIATKACFLKVSLQTGNIISSSSFQFDTISNYMLGINCVFMPYDSMYYATCSVDDSITLESSQTLTKLDRNFNCLKSVHISDNTFNFLYQNPYSCLLSNREHILTSYTKRTASPFSYNQALLSQLDTSLNVIWTKQYGYPNNDYSLSDLQFNHSDSTYTGTMYPLIVTLNNQGEFLTWRLLIDFPFTAMITKSILPYTDTTSIFISTYQKLNFQSTDVLINLSRKDGYGCFDFAQVLPWQNVSSNFFPLQTSNLPLTIQQLSNTLLLNQSAPLVVECVTTSTLPDDQKQLTIQVAPNPSSGQIRIKSSSDRIRQWQLFQLTGLPIFSELIESQTEFIVDITDIAPGVYILLLYPDSSSILPAKIKIVKI